MAVTKRKSDELCRCGERIFKHDKPCIYVDEKIAEMMGWKWCWVVRERNRERWAEEQYYLVHESRVETTDWSDEGYYNPKKVLIPPDQHAEMSKGEGDDLIVPIPKFTEEISAAMEAWCELIGVDYLLRPIKSIDSGEFVWCVQKIHWASELVVACDGQACLRVETIVVFGGKNPALSICMAVLRVGNKR